MSPVTDDDVLSIAPRVKVRWDEARATWLALVPEGVVVLNDSAAEVLRACDGARTVGALIESLSVEHPEAPRDTLADDVRSVLERMLSRRLLTRAKT